MSEMELGSLSLGRKAGESILIGDDIRIEVVSVGQRVRLKITAPTATRIVREELICRTPDDLN